MKARPSVETILGKLTRDERKILIAHLDKLNMSFRDQIGLRLYVAAACAAYDVLNVTDQMDDFVTALDEIVTGHSEEVYGPKRHKNDGDISELARDMMDYLRGEGVHSTVLEQLYEQVFKEAGDDAERKID